MEGRCLDGVGWGDSEPLDGDSVALFWCDIYHHPQPPESMDFAARASLGAPFTRGAVHSTKGTRKQAMRRGVVSQALRTSGGGPGGPRRPGTGGGGDGGGNDDDSRWSGMLLSAGLPCALIASSDAAKPAAQTSSVRPTVDWNRVWAFLMCLALPALAITQRQKGEVNANSWVALMLMLAAPSLWTLRAMGFLTTVSLGWGEWAIANSYIAAQLFATANVFLGVSLV